MKFRRNFSAEAIVILKNVKVQYFRKVEPFCLQLNAVEAYQENLPQAFSYNVCYLSKDLLLFFFHFHDNI